MPFPTPAARRASRATRVARLVAATAAVATFSVGGPLALPADAAPQTASAPTYSRTTLAQMEVELAHKINGDRWLRGVDPIPFHTILRDQGRAWSTFMAYFGELFHHPDLGSQATLAWSGWTGAAENVGRGTSVAGIHRAFMASPTHRANVLGDWRTVGVGIHEARGQLWVTVRFMR